MKAMMIRRATIFCSYKGPTAYRFMYKYVIFVLPLFISAKTAEYDGKNDNPEIIFTVSS